MTPTIPQLAILSPAADATEELGRRLGGLLPGGSVVALHGTLGAGKTVFARGLARGLGITEHITSPTFTIAQEYRGTDGRLFFHLDMYRIRDEHDALAFGVEEYLFVAGALTVIEWAERIPALLVPVAAQSLVEVFFAPVSEDSRRLVLPAVWAQQLGFEASPAGARC